MLVDIFGNIWYPVLLGGTQKLDLWLENAIFYTETNTEICQNWILDSVSKNGQIFMKFKKNPESSPRNQVRNIIWWY